jgi:hypothetical protein
VSARPGSGSVVGREPLREHLEIAVLAHTSGLLPQAILVQRDHLGVRQRLDRVAVHPGEIASDDQR